MTNLQAQCLLAYLGHYPHSAIDGIWGSRSRRGLKAFQSSRGLTADGILGQASRQALRQAVGAGEEDFWAGIRYFTREEFRCRCGGKDCGGFPAEPNETLVQLADDLRGHFGHPAHATSGLRCAAHNARVGGVSNSRHVSGKALDFYIEGIPGDTLLAQAQLDSRTRYAYRIQGSDCIHIDVL